MGPLGALSARTAYGAPPSAAVGYGPLVPKGDHALPAEFNYQVVDRQGIPMRDGRPTPGIFDAMGAYPDAGGGVHGRGDRTILIRNHENRERPGEIKVITGPGLEYDETAFGGNTKLVVESWRTFFKGGWRPTPSGQLVHQIARLEAGGRRISLAVLTDANPTHDYGVRTVEGVAARVLEDLPAPRSRPSVSRPATGHGA